MQQIPNIEFIQGIELPEVDIRHPHLVVLDDLMIDATKNKDVSNLFTVGSHHRNTSVICLLQNLFYQGKENRTLTLNSHYLVLFKNPRDQLQVMHLARQMYPGKTAYFMEKFQKATSKPYGCLVVDLKQETADQERLRTGNGLRGEGGGMQEDITPKQETNLLMPKPPGIAAYPDRKDGMQGEGDIRKESDVHTCASCGVLFRSPYFLHLHQQKSCNPDDDEEDGNPWAPLLQQAYDEHDKTYRGKVEELMDDGVREENATRQVTHDLMPKYRSSLVNIYKTTVMQIYELDRNKQHEIIMNAVNWYMEWKNYKFDKALDTMLRKKRHVFYEIIEDEEEDEDDIPLSKLKRC